MCSISDNSHFDGLSASNLFTDQDALIAALVVAIPLLTEIPNFTKTRQQMLIGGVIG